MRGVQAVLERPNGTRIPFMPYPTPLRDASGNLVAASNVLLKITKLHGSDRIDLQSGPSDDLMPDMTGAGLELDHLTGTLQATLAAVADVEFGFQIDCERLDGWSGAQEEKDQILSKLEQKRQRERAALYERLEQLQQHARDVMTQWPYNPMRAMPFIASGFGTAH